jgi:rhodanese-related sulfurtransferase
MRTVKIWRHKDAVFVIGLIVVSSVAGYAVNALRAQPLPWVYQNKEQRLALAVGGIVSSRERPAEPESDVELPEVVSLEAFLKMREDKSVVVLDARPAIFFGLGHVPGALNLPREDFEASYARISGALAGSRTVVVYCASETCEDAGLVRTALVKLGPTRVVIFHGGWAEWKAEGLAEGKSP